MLNKFAGVAVIAASLGLATVAFAQDTGSTDGGTTAGGGTTTGDATITGGAAAQTNGGGDGISTGTGDISTMPAAGQSTGVVTQVDETDRTVTLDDGFVYDLPEGFNIGLLTNGQKVNVVWEHTGGRLHVTSLELAS